MDTRIQVPPPAEPEGEVLAAVEELPVKYRTAIYLYYYESYSAQEIGRIMRVPTATVHTWLARGRQKLKTLLGGKEYEQA